MVWVFHLAPVSHKKSFSWHALHVKRNAVSIGWPMALCRHHKAHTRDFCCTDGVFFLRLFHADLSCPWQIDVRIWSAEPKNLQCSLEPNCGAKILMVDGSHRVGIFALKDLVAGQELLYNYLYTPDQAPEWARTGWSNAFLVWIVLQAGWKTCQRASNHWGNWALIWAFTSVTLSRSHFISFYSHHSDRSN